MKKFLTAMATILTVVVMALTLAGCSDKAGSIKKAFEKEGYTVSAIKAEDSEWLQSHLSDEDKKDIDKYEVFTCTKKDGLLSASATVIKFPSKDKLAETVGQSTYDSAVESGLVNGNCYLVLPLGLDAKGIIEIFKNA